MQLFAPTITTPAGIIIPATTPGYTQSPGGILLPQLSTPSVGEITPAKPEDIERAPQLLAERYAELEAAHGTAAADAMMGAEMQIADRASAQIRQERIMAAMLAGDIEGALAAASQR